jgi:pyruvate-formate lyase-activating enzyme
VDEVLGVALPHLEKAEDAIVSFGQGCEGEPLMQWWLLERSILELREKTDRGTINLNTNGSFPQRVERLCEAGLDSIRVTLNSPHPKFYRRYHQPRRYTLEKVIDSLTLAKEEGLYTSINLLVLPGFSDREKEVEGWVELVRNTRLDLIQMRNLNIDPDFYLKEMGRGEGMGISRMIEVLKAEVPSLQFGYFNRTKEHFILMSKFPLCCPTTPRARFAKGGDYVAAANKIYEQKWIQRGSKAGSSHCFGLLACGDYIRDSGSEGRAHFLRSGLDEPCRLCRGKPISCR